MRLAFFFLLLVNLVLFVWGQGYFGGQDQGREPARLERQLVPEKLHVVSGTTTVAPTAEKPAVDCRRIEGLSADEAKSLTDAVHVRGGWETRTLPMTVAPMHWVAIIDLPNSAAAEKKKTELRQFGVTDSEITAGTTEGTFAVSLGLFREPERAQEFLQRLTGKGVRSARIVRRESEKFAVELRAPTDQLAATLPGLATALPQSTTQECPAP